MFPSHAALLLTSTLGILSHGSSAAHHRQMQFYNVQLIYNPAPSIIQLHRCEENMVSGSQGKVQRKALRANIIAALALLYLLHIPSIYTLCCCAHKTANHLYATLLNSLCQHCPTRLSTNQQHASINP